jgi:hypothetical protein
MRPIASSLRTNDHDFGTEQSSNSVLLTSQCHFSIKAAGEKLHCIQACTTQQFPLAAKDQKVKRFPSSIAHVESA